MIIQNKYRYIQDYTMLSPNSCGKYFRLGSTTRRHSVIGCLGYENADPCPYPYAKVVDTSEIGVGTNDDNDECNVSCAICLDALTSTCGVGCAPQKNIATTECGHTFCLSCLLKNLRTSNLCPLCRAPIEKDVKNVLKPLSYSEGIQLLNHELNGLDIYNNVEHFVQDALDISNHSNQPNTNGQNVQDVIDGVVNMVTNFGFNLLFDATLHTNGGEERHMDEEWIIQMYNDDSDDGSNGSDSTINDYNDSSSSSGSDDDDDDDDDGDDDGESTIANASAITIRLPEVPESMF